MPQYPFRPDVAARGAALTASWHAADRAAVLAARATRIIALPLAKQGG